MAQILLGCLVGKVPAEVLVCYRALLDFIYIAQYPTHDNDSLQYLEDALDLFHTNKHIFVDCSIWEHLDIPKFHSMVHYVESIRNFETTDNYNTEMFEQFHIDMAKEGWRASNFRNEVPQMTQWLSRQEKVSLFQSYLRDTLESDEMVNEEIELPPIPSISTSLGLSQKPTAPNQAISNIQRPHHAPSFSLHLRQYLNGFLSREESIACAQLATAQLPFDWLDIWHTYKFALDVLGNDIDGQENIKAVRAKPGKEGEARFDTVLVAHKDTAETTGLQGAQINHSISFY